MEFYVCFVQLQGISHDNILPFIGASIEPGEICYVTQYCSRGTVQVSVGCKLVLIVIYCLNYICGYHWVAARPSNQRQRGVDFYGTK
jgi:hypothetical protein